MPLNPTTEIRDMRKGDWYWIEKAVIFEYASQVGAVGILVYNVLAAMTNERQSCFPSQAYIAKVLGYSRPTVNRAIHKLRHYGLIQVNRRAKYHCVYTLLKVRCKNRE